MVSDHTKRVRDILAGSNLQGDDLKDALRQIVRENWPSLPPWSTLSSAAIEEAQKATVGAGTVLTFLDDDDVRKVLLGEAGEHYNFQKRDLKSAYYTNPGGFINLTETPGSSLVPASDEPEDGRVGAARETEEEFRDDAGVPLFRIDPERLKPMDTKTLAFRNGEKRIVFGMMMELTAQEVLVAKKHVRRLESDPQYKAAVAAHTLADSGLPEIAGAKIFSLADVAEGQCPLLHQDQQSLFKRVHENFKTTTRIVTRRRGATASYQTKVKTLDELKALVRAWRRKTGVAIGITSGAFDIVHPGHVSFLEDASREFGRLIVIVASDRTIKEQKGEERPYIHEVKRAQTIAGLSAVDAVIISDEYYHELILSVLRPDILFKGDDYAGKEIMGADFVKEVVLIPCAEKTFYSSSAFIQKIKTGHRDQKPEWADGPSPV